MSEVVPPTPWVIGVGVALLGFFGIVMRMIGPWRKQITETEERLRKELQEALAEERRTVSEERTKHAVERADLTNRVGKLERIIGRERIRHNAERALDRHKLNNIIQCFDAVVLLIETNPDKAPEIIVKVKELRATQMVAEAEEKATIRAAEIAADEAECDHDGN